MLRTVLMLESTGLVCVLIAGDDGEGEGESGISKLDNSRFVQLLDKLWTGCSALTPEGLALWQPHTTLSVAQLPDTSANDHVCIGELNPAAYKLGVVHANTAIPLWLSSAPLPSCTVNMTCRPTHLE